MGNNDDLKTVIFRKISNILLDYPEFQFLLKILGGAAALGVVYLIIRLMLPK